MFVWGHICCVATESNSETHPGRQEEKPDLRRATALIVCHHLTQQGTPRAGDLNVIGPTASDGPLET